MSLNADGRRRKARENIVRAANSFLHIPFRLYLLGFFGANLDAVAARDTALLDHHRLPCSTLMALAGHSRMQV